MKIVVPKSDFQVVIGKRYKRVTMQRTLLSKLYWDKNNFLLQDVIALFENQLFLEHLASRDPKFAETFGRSLEPLSLVLKQTKVLGEKDIPKLGRNLRKFVKSHSGVIYPRRNLEEQWKRYKRFVSFRSFSRPGTPTKKLPPQAYIGKGYTDKGTAKKPHLDGSPSWQEVAMATRKLNEETEEETLRRLEQAEPSIDWKYFYDQRKQ